MLPRRRSANALARGVRTGVRRCGCRRADEDRVEGGGEFGVAIPDQESEATAHILKVHEQVAGQSVGGAAVWAGVCSAR
jgi:hypothetical protein